MGGVSGQRKGHRAPGHQTAERNHGLLSAAASEGAKAVGWEEEPMLSSQRGQRCDNTVRCFQYST